MTGNTAGGKLQILLEPAKRPMNDRLQLNLYRHSLICMFLQDELAGMFVSGYADDHGCDDGRGHDRDHASGLHQF